MDALGRKQDVLLALAVCAPRCRACDLVPNEVFRLAWLPSLAHSRVHLQLRKHAKQAAKQVARHTTTAFNTKQVSACLEACRS